MVLIKYSKLLVLTFIYKNLKYTTLNTPLARVIPEIGALIVDTVGTCHPGIGALIEDTVGTCHPGNKGAYCRIGVIQKQLCYFIIIDRVVPATPAAVVKETARPKGLVHFHKRNSRTQTLYANNVQLHPRPSVNPGKRLDKLVSTKGGCRKSR